MKRNITIPLSVLTLVLLDQLVKFYIVSDFKLGQVRDFIPQLVSLTYLQNTGAAFSMLENQQWLFTLVTFLVIGGAVYYLIKHLHASKWLLAGLTLVIAGGLGNFIDRLRQGFVVDMFQLEFIHFAVFNVADMYLTFGVAILLLLMIKEEKDGSKN
ncbi:signal peptidase II [Streptococcus panodentis]|uniref:Lipoprotein signal peptidase n=1 Tax=Streptococcus panodentis TaxID=1581472 RepID=A0ABS5ATE6_9STRE|nr:signal peptidase II [Streptococcus panodentis]MBP2619839.1 signal peptidase II [Streptococcus panodentis]